MAILKYIVIIAIGALASMLANRGIAVFNDGFRAIVPQYYDKQISRKELAAISFSISFGLVIGFGVPLSELAGGITSITTAAILMTGVVASVLGPTLCKLFRLTDDIAKGAAYGTAGHVIGTTKAMEQSALAGAASSLSLVVAGLLTAVIFPVVVSFL